MGSLATLSTQARSARLAQLRSAESSEQTHGQQAIAKLAQSIFTRLRTAGRRDGIAGRATLAGEETSEQRHPQTGQRGGHVNPRFAGRETGELG